MFDRLLLLFLACALLAPAQIITTIAGNGASGYSGDGGPATSAQINNAVGLAVDGEGNRYIADQNNHRIRKIDRNGVITTLAGTGVAGFSGDGGPAAQAQINGPTGVCTDTAGNVYIDDLNNRRIRRVSRAGTITTVAGNGSSIYSVSGGPATAAGLFLPIRCAVDTLNNLYIADQGAHRIVRVNNDGIATTVAGTGAIGFSGDGGPATAASLNNPTAVAVDPAGNLYITDQSNHRIRRVTPAGVIDTVAGNGSNSYSGDGGAATAASLNYPGSIVLDANSTLFIVDTINQRIRRVTGTTINTIAGTGTAGYSGDGGPATAAQVNNPFAIAVDSAGNVLFGDTTNNRIRSISSVAAARLPLITSAGVTNAASFQTGIAPGGMLTLFGTNLGASPGQILTPTTAAWPTTLNGVQVFIDGEPRPVYRVLNLNGSEQLTVQAPYTLAGKTSTTVQVSTPAGIGSPVTVPVVPAQPGIFVLDGAGSVAVKPDASIITAANPAGRGETVVLYLTGLGLLDLPPDPGQPASLTTLARTVIQPSVTIGGANATVVFSGLTPGFISLYQINLIVLPSTPVGLQDLVVQANGVSSNTGKITIR